MSENFVQQVFNDAVGVKKAKSYFESHRRCGHPTSGAWLNDGHPCEMRLGLFELACRHHTDRLKLNIENLAWAAYKVGHEQGLNEGWFRPRDAESIWGPKEIRSRITLKPKGLKCLGSASGKPCDNNQDEFSDRCHEHMTPAEMNAVLLAEAAAGREQRRWWTPEKAASLLKAQTRRNRVSE